MLEFSGIAVPSVVWPTSSGTIEAKPVRWLVATLGKRGSEIGVPPIHGRIGSRASGTEDKEPRRERNTRKKTILFLTFVSFVFFVVRSPTARRKARDCLCCTESRLAYVALAGLSRTPNPTGSQGDALGYLRLPHWGLTHKLLQEPDSPGGIRMTGCSFQEIPASFGSASTIRPAGS